MYLFRFWFPHGLQLADDVADVVGVPGGEQARQDNTNPPQVEIQPQRGEQVSTRG